MKPWTWACLLCNEVGNERDVAPQLHRCERTIEGLGGFWTWRIGRQRPELTDAQIAKMISRPVMRVDLSQILGANWLPAGDIL